MSVIRSPAILAILGAICLQHPAAGDRMLPHHFLLAVADGIGLLALAFLEVRIRWGRH